MAVATFDRLYVWERPVRLYHWVTVASLATLVATGLLIGQPLALVSSGDASSSYSVGIIRFLHFVAGFTFTFVFVVRVYWMFAGNRYASWQAFLPLTPTLLKRQLKLAKQVVKADLLEIQKEPVEIVGHNPIAAWSYAAIFAATVFQIATGFALYAPMSGFWLPQLFSWTTVVFGSEAALRQWHHAATWVFILFTGVHVYLCVYHDIVEGRGELSSMVNGTKYVEGGGH